MTWFGVWCEEARAWLKDASGVVLWGPEGAMQAQRDNRPGLAVRAINTDGSPGAEGLR